MSKAPYQRMDKAYTFDDFTAAEFSEFDIPAWNQSLCEATPQDWVIDGTLLASVGISFDRSEDTSKFSFSAASIPLIESALLVQATKLDVSWGKGHEQYQVKRLKLPSGLRTSSPKHLNDFDAYLQRMGSLYTYILARELKGKVIFLNGQIALRWGDSTMPECFTSQKLRKFLVNGPEDSPSAFLEVLKSKAKYQPFFDMLSNGMKDAGIDYDGRQDWYADDGAGGQALSRVVYLDAARNVVREFFYAEVDPATGIAEVFGL